MTLFGSVRLLDARSLGGPVVDATVAAGEVLLLEGTVTGTFSVIRSGTAELLRGGRVVGSLGPGDCFGEIDPLSTEPQRYTVIATSSLRVLTFSTFGIGRLCDALPGTRERIIESLPGSSAEVHELPRKSDAYPLSPARSRSAVGSSTVIVR